MNRTAKFPAKKLFLAVFSMIICSQMLPAQDIRLGRATPEDFIQGPYEKDPDASAVILYDKGETIFDLHPADRNFYYDYKRTLRMQILDERGFDWADYDIRLYETSRTREAISGFRAFVHNLDDGKVNTTRIRQNAMLTEQTTDGMKTMKLTFPEVRAGSIIELTYTIRSHFLFSPRAWQFQYSVPVEYSEFVFVYPDYYNYNFFMQGFEVPVINDRKLENKTVTLSGSSDRIFLTNNHHRWVMKDLPAMRSESFTTNIANYYSAIFFELASIIFPGSRPDLYVSNWSDVDKLLNDSESFGGYLSGSRQLRNEMSGLANDEAGEKEKIASVLEWFHKNIRWNERTGIAANSSANQVLRRGSGNAAEINLLLVAALREMGLNANPVVSSTRRNGIVLQAFPTINRFNYVIAGVELENKELLLLDATDAKCRVGMLPLRAINYHGRMIGNNFARWVDLQIESSMHEKMQIMASISPDGKMEGNLKIIASDFAAYSVRRDIEDHADLNEYLETFKKRYSNLEMNNFEIDNRDALETPIMKNVEFTATDGIQQAADFIYFSPLLIEGMKENPFKLEERKYPVDFSVPIYEDLTFVYKLPEGFVIDHLPGKATFNFGRNARYNFDAKEDEAGQIVITSLLEISTSFFTPQDYAGLKDFFNKIVEKQNEQIVLKSNS